MLSQRIGFLFLNMSGQITNGAPVSEIHWHMIETALEDFAAANALLLNGDAAGNISAAVLAPDRHCP